MSWLPDLAKLGWEGQEAKGVIESSELLDKDEVISVDFFSIY